MSDEQLSALKQAFVTLDKMQNRIDELEQRQNEPIAIIGMGCRFPGEANSPEAFWQLLKQGVDTVRDIPANRWSVDEYYDPDPHIPGKMCTRRGAFLDDIEYFDPTFFGISPQEAISVDPQQRLLLEVAWEALEDAGQVEDQLGESETGVFVGIISKDYAKYIEQDNLDSINNYYCTGNDFSFAAGRLAYVLGLQGPSMAIDTACSSSLVAVHLACQSLRTGECTMALAGGVSLILTPHLNIFLTKTGALSPDGRCKTFSANADGTGRGEGCGVVVLKRLSTALAHHDRILAVIGGSAINHDGPSGSFTIPNGLAQQKVMRRALTNARILPKQVGYVETHGTGTLLGDPIEVEALNAVYSEGRSPEHPLLIGSAKTVIGHLDPASGMAGLIKAVLILKHASIPMHLYAEELNPYIPWQHFSVAVPRTPVTWAPDTFPRTAAVSAFGLSGTNAHVIVQEFATAPMPATPSSADTPPLHHHLLTLSAHNDVTLRAQAETYAQWLTHASSASTALGDICYTANTRRTHHRHRLAVTGRTHTEIATQLQAFLSDKRADEKTREPSLSPHTSHKLAFVFTDQVSPWLCAGKQLLEQEERFRQVVTECDQLFQPYSHRSLLYELKTYTAQSLSQEIEVLQPLLFTVEVALAALWRSWGIMPSVVIGHGIGEITAAYVADILTLEDALKLTYYHSHQRQQANYISLLQELRPQSGQIPMISSISAYYQDGQAFNGTYWAHSRSAPDRFMTAIETLIQDGYKTFLEISPDPVHMHAIAVSSSPPDALFASLQKGHDERECMLASLGALHCLGWPVHWSNIYPTGQLTSLPTYAWQRTRLWWPTHVGWSSSTQTPPTLPLPESPTRPWQLLLLAAQSGPALEQVKHNLALYIEQHPQEKLADIAYTLQEVSSTSAYRQIFVCRDRDEAYALLQNASSTTTLRSYQPENGQSVAFLLAGVGEQYPGMARKLYEQENTFRALIDYCCLYVEPQLHLDLRDLLFAPATEQADPTGLDLRVLMRSARGKADPTLEQLQRTDVAQPLTFIIEYALAQLLMEWGIRPQALLGYSLGEYVAACLAGVLSLQDALTLVTHRAQLIQTLPQGSLLAVMLSESKLAPYLSASVQLALVNSPQTCVLAGPEDAIRAIELQLDQQDVAHQRVQSTHAFHSNMMESARAELNALASTFILNPPSLPYLSNVTGTWITAEQATDPEYWGKHMCQTVRFAEGLDHLLRDTEHVLIEIGPGQTLSSFVHQTFARSRPIFATLPARHESLDELAYLLTTVGKLWLSGVSIDRAGLYKAEQRRSLPLPPHPALVETQHTAQRPLQDVPYVAPRNDLERQVATLWEQQLGIDAIGIHDNFFDLGGNSLVGIKLIAHLRKILQNEELPIYIFYEAPSISELMQYLEETQPDLVGNTVHEYSKPQSKGLKRHTH